MPVIEARSKQSGVPKVVERWGDPDSSKAVLAASIDDRKSNHVWFFCALFLFFRIAVCYAFFWILIAIDSFRPSFLFWQSLDFYVWGLYSAILPQLLIFLWRRNIVHVYLCNFECHTFDIGVRLQVFNGLICTKR